MRKVLVVDTHFERYRAAFEAHEIQLVVHKRAQASEGIDAMILPAHSWPVTSRKHHVPIIAYGSLSELRQLINETEIGYLVETDAMTLDGLVAALKVLWREGAGGEELNLEEMFEQAELPPRLRETMRLRVEGRSRDETAKRMKISESTVRAQTTTGLNRLGVKSVEELRQKIRAVK